MFNPKKRGTKNMRRFASEKLDKWLDDPGRKPLVIRGARQVGKTWLARDLAERRGLRLVELNFERLPGLADLFASNNPQEIVRNIGAETGAKIEPEESLLFLDEIQAAPEVLSTLRWFREDMPELPIVAAGSLLDFALGDARFSTPVGRISYFYIEPLSFLEFVLACGNEPLFETLSSFSMGEDIPETLHGKCLDMCRDYFLSGGMPESVVSWREQKDPGRCMKIQQDLLATFRDDFHKYGAKFDPLLLDRLLASSAEQLGS